MFPPEDFDDIDWGHEAYVDPPPMPPLTQAEIEFWWVDVDDDGNEIPPPRHKVH